MPLPCNLLKLSMKPRAARGLATPEAADANETSLLISNTKLGVVATYSLQAPSKAPKVTLLPTQYI